MQNQTSDPFFDPHAWLTQHHTVAMLLGAFCLWVSICLILRMWLMHRREPFIHKLVWTFFLLIPLFGWIFYAAFFRVPDHHNSPCEVSSSYADQQSIQ